MAVIAVRTVLIYAVLIAAMRLMGRRQLGELQPIELVVTLMIADVAAVPMQDTSIPLLYGMIPVMILIALEILLSALMLKSRRMTTLISGEPMVVIRHGVIDQKVMKRLRLSVEDLVDSLRGQGIFTLGEVHTAVAETGGRITAYLYPGSAPATRADVGVPAGDDGMPVLVMADGKFSAWGLALCGLSERDVLDELAKRGLKKKQVFLIEADDAGHFAVVKKERNR